MFDDNELSIISKQTVHFSSAFVEQNSVFLTLILVVDTEQTAMQNLVLL